MIRGLVLLAAAVAGCADPVVEMSLRMPDADTGASFDTSCVRSIDVYAYGNDFPNSPLDKTRDCIDLTEPAATFSEIRREMLGNFDLRIPPNGLSEIEVYGHVGACEDNWEQVPPDMMFYGAASYSGDNQITIPLEGMVSCAMQTVSVRPIDVLALAANPADCAAAALADSADDSDGYVDLGQIMTTMDGPAWFGGDRTYAKLAGGLASMQARMTASKHACVGVSAYSGNQDTTSCMIQNQAKLCGAGQWEVGTMDWMIAESLIDPAKAANWSTAIIGSVWVSAPTKGAVSGARVTVDPDLGEVQYVEPGATVTRNLTGTGTSGLFVLYTDSIVDVTISGGGGSRTVRLGGDPDVIATSLVVLQ
ncbi:MAG TPA: hypothetical protein VIU61_29305 [Kofleriaceae bacterium]